MRDVWGGDLEGEMYAWEEPWSIATAASGEDGGGEGRRVGGLGCHSSRFAQGEVVWVRADLMSHALEKECFHGLPVLAELWPFSRE